MSPAVLAVEAEEDWVRETAAKCAGRQPEIAAFTLYDREDDEPVGTSSLFEIQWRPRRATFGILLGIRRGTGLGTEATRLVLDWGFNVLGLASILLEVLPHNAAAIAAYEHAGFQRVGIRRDAVVELGKPGDVLLMDAVPIEFRSRRAGSSKRSSLSLAQRGSGARSCAWSGSSLRFAPHCGHSPAQSGRQRTCGGRASA